MSTEIKKGDKVRIKHDIAGVMNNQGRKGKVIRVDKIHETALVRLKKGVLGYYNISWLEKVNENLNFKDLQLGKCYKNKASYIRIDSTNPFGTPRGVFVTCFTDGVEIWNDSIILSNKLGDEGYKEISHKKFEKVLQAARQVVADIYERVKSKEQ